MVNARQTQEIRPTALGKTQIVGVIDDAREIRVFVVDPNRQTMRLAVDPARKVGPIGTHG